MAWLKEVAHRCVMPDDLGDRYEGSIWQCDTCNRKYMIVERDEDRSATWARLCGKRFQSYDFSYWCSNKANHRGNCDD